MVAPLLLAVACGRNAASTVGSLDAGSSVHLDASGVALPRARTLLQGPWRFSGAGAPPVGPEATSFDDSAWELVAVPHTWNLEKQRFSASGTKIPFEIYANAWYRTHVTLAAGDAGRRVYLDFEGVGIIADVFVNGRKLGQHRGAYTRFVFDATSAIAFGADNVIAVKVDNTDASATDVLPATPLARNYYKPYGGIYRKAWLLLTDRVAIDPMDHATSGVYVTARNATSAGADVSIRTMLRNDLDAAATFHVTNRIVDGAGVVVATLTSDVALGAGARGPSVVDTRVAGPHLWQTVAPYLYTVQTEVSLDGTVRDRVDDRFGIRSFELRPDGFFLNGVNTPLRGVSKHQESEAHRAAMTDTEIVQDWDRLQELGANYVRLVHYPHADLEYRLADERGILLWAENGNSTPNAGTDTGEAITRDMVRQGYNHPSIVFFSAGNESITDEASRLAVVRYAKAIKDEDPTRLSTFADPTLSFTDPSLDFVASNLYPGWYGGTVWDFDTQAPSLHFISETGGRSVVTQHTDYAATRLSIASFEPEEYLARIAESRMQTIFRNSPGSIPVFAWWAFRDFLLDGRPRDVNDSGVLSADGAYRKDAFYVLQTFFRPDVPLVHIASKAYFVRRGAASNGVKVYANRPSIRLSLNGADAGSIANGIFKSLDGGHAVDNVFYWPVALRQGMNDLVASDDQGHTDTCGIYFAGTGGLPPDPTATPLVEQLSSSSSGTPAYFFERPIASGFPVYGELDGSADNTFSDVPALVAAASRIVSFSLSKPANAAAIVSFAIRANAPGADVIVMASATTLPGFLAQAGFADTGVRGTWRNGWMDLVPFGLYAKRFSGGDRVALGPGNGIDWVAFVQ